MSASATDLTPVRVERYLCPYCERKAYASKSGTRRHMAECHRNPANRACSSCVHFHPTPCCIAASDQCGCMGRNECAAGAFESWRYDDHDTLAPVADGWWTHVEDWRRDCPSHQAVPS